MTINSTKTSATEISPIPSRATSGSGSIGPWLLWLAAALTTAAIALKKNQHQIWSICRCTGKRVRKSDSPKLSWAFVCAEVCRTYCIRAIDGKKNSKALLYRKTTHFHSKRKRSNKSAVILIKRGPLIVMKVRFNRNLVMTPFILKF